ncbi:MAG: Pyrophosphatase PpaX, partial [Alphaproteobacteria bacterium MarineAlpha5_Bin11]
MIKNLIFDFDGVIVDTELLAAKSFSIVLKNMDIIYSAEDIAEKFSGHKMIQVTEDLSKIYKIGDKKIFLAKVMKIMNNYYKNDLTYVEKINHFLNSIKCNFFICSNSGSQRIIKGLEKVKLDHFFDKSKIYTFEHVLRPKPYPDVYLKVINDNNLKKEETLVL